MELTPKEKAKELVDRFLGIKKINPESITRPYNYQEAQQGALICVDEVINSGFGSRLIQFEYPNKNSTKLLSPIKYWNEVKKELEKL